MFNQHYIPTSPAGLVSKKIFIPLRNTIRVSNGLDPDQDRQSVGSDLGPNCLQRFPADDKSPHSKDRVKVLI